MSHKIQKLRRHNASFVSALPDAEVSKSVGIFRGVHVYVDGYTIPSKEEIRQLMLQHGGGFEHYETKSVTHILATHLPASKLLLLQKAKTRVPVVHPDWIVQSIEHKQLLPVDRFKCQGFTDPTQCPLFPKTTCASWPTLCGPKSRTYKAPSLKNDADLVLNHTIKAAIARDDQEEEEEEEEGEEEEDVVDAKGAVDDVLLGAQSRTLQTNSTRDGPAFVRHFFAKSRLHHLGTWRSTFQQKAGEFQATYRGRPVSRAPASSIDRVLVHVDMDCFFVAVAVRGRPELQDVPVAVAHSDKAGSSEISSCNYLARAQGLCAGMAMHTAKVKCPQVVVLPYDFDAIERVSCQIYGIFFSYTPLVQAVSCDEAVLEFAKGTKGVNKAQRIRHDIYEQTGCRASVGVSFNALVAKVASKKAKPDGICHVRDPKEAATFMQSLQLRDLPGVGRKTRAKLKALGVDNVEQLVLRPKGELVQLLGKASGEMLFDYARGRDVRPLSVESNMTRKSVSAVVNFGIRFDTWQDATVFLTALSEELSHRLRSLKVRTTCLTLLIKKRAQGAPVEPSKFMGHGVCDNFSKSHVLTQATDDEVVIGKICIELLRQLNFPSKELRGVGVQATKLTSDPSSNRNERSDRVFKTWLKDSAPQGEGITSLLHSRQESTTRKQEEAKAETEDEHVYGNNLTRFSQIKSQVLKELPEQLQQEILTWYGQGAPSTAFVGGMGQLPLKRKTHGKVPLRRRHSARNMFDSKSNSRLARALHTCDEIPRKADALDDVRMSQIDSEVYDSLPFAIRQEIARYAKKRRPTWMIASRLRPSSVLDTNTREQSGRKTAAVPVVVASIEDLYANLVESLDGGAVDKESKYEGPSDKMRAQSAAFDAIYSRILVEVEKRALDEVML